MKEYMEYGLYALGLGFLMGIIGNVAGITWLIPLGAIIAFAGFVAWRKDKKRKDKATKNAYSEYIQYGTKKGEK